MAVAARQRRNPRLPAFLDSQVRSRVRVFRLRRAAVPRRAGSGRGLEHALGRIALFLAAVFAASDEFHQSFVPSRGPSVWDVLLDTQPPPPRNSSSGYWLRRPRLRHPTGSGLVPISWRGWPASLPACWERCVVTFRRVHLAINDSVLQLQSSLRSWATREAPRHGRPDFLVQGASDASRQIGVQVFQDGGRIVLTQVDLRQQQSRAAEIRVRQDGFARNLFCLL